ncbi:MAG: hypothetical protein MUO23_03790 [Anaerolineales bacterium]|nr:hypothetical protein [Anaerolineales bacterium]
MGTLAGFQESDCAVPGLTFASPTIGDEVNEVFDGPSLICAASSEGAHGLSEFALIGITAYKADKLGEFYKPGRDSNEERVARANEWNALPDLPTAARYEIDLILNDEDGYVSMITSESNVYGCLLGDGFGTEKIEGKYLVNIQFESCELGDAAAYTAALESLRAAALAAIERVETARQK